MIQLATLINAGLSFHEAFGILSPEVRVQLFARAHYITMKPIRDPNYFFAVRPLEGNAILLRNDPEAENYDPNLFPCYIPIEVILRSVEK